MTEYNYRVLADELGIRGTIVLKKYLRARCPLHDGRHDSFSLNIETGAWVCFSNCGHGNFVKLVRSVMHVSMVGAYDWIYDHEHAAPLSRHEEEPTQPPHEWWRDHYNEASDTELPQWWFDRGLNWYDRQQWMVRWHVTRQQLIIPAWWHGSIVGTVSRNFTRMPKYQNSSRLPRRQMLFGLRDADTAIVLVEGALDAIWLRKHGHPAAALLGLTMSDEQMRLLRNVDEICLALDNDDPGIGARMEIAARLRKVRRGATVTRVDYPAGHKDVSECSATELASMVAQRRIAA